jgi:hypothetical protein
METTEYRCAIVRPLSHDVLVFADAGRYRLPWVQIPRAARPAQEVPRAIKAKWGLNIFVLEVWMTQEGIGPCAVAELLKSKRAKPLRGVPLKQLMTSELLEEEYRRVQLLIEGGQRSPFSHLGWIDEAIAWMESATGRTFRSRGNIDQWNAGEGFALLTARSDDGRQYWLKATGEPNMHEFGITRFLWELCPDFLPKLVADRKDWNAWLIEHAGDPLPDPPSLSELVSAARRMAQLQLLTIGETDELLALGAFDQRLPALRSHIDVVIAYLIEAMARQTSTKAAPLSRGRLLGLGEILRDGCFRLEALHIPDALIHNDLNVGNILSDGTNCVFTDWCEAAVGNPFIVCERLCQLNPCHRESVQAVYRHCWSDRLSIPNIEEALAVMPLLAIYAYLYGRGAWPRQTESTSPQFESYARSLARHMDRVARDTSLLEALCH